MPSFNLYRGALLIMLVGTAIAVFLLVRPPGESKGSSPVVVGKTTATPSRGDATAKPAGTPQPTTEGATATPGDVTGTPDGEVTGTPDARTTPVRTPTGSPFGEYTVQPGDTLFDIANANLPSGDNPVSFAKAIAALNNLDYDAPVLPIGTKLLLPKPER